MALSNRLSERERAVNDAYDAGLSVNRISALLGIKPNVVRGYRSAAMRKIDRATDGERREPDRISAPRIAKELAEGARCGAKLFRGVCCLLKPCWDHDGA